MPLRVFVLLPTILLLINDIDNIIKTNIDRKGSPEINMLILILRVPLFLPNLGHQLVYAYNFHSHLHT